MNIGPSHPPPAGKHRKAMPARSHTSLSIPSILVTEDHPAQVKKDTPVEKLRQEFDVLLSIKDELERDYFLIQQAKASDIATDIYKEMFVSHRERKVRVLGTIMPWIRQAGAFIGYLTIFSGLFLFIMEADARKEAAHNESWKILNEVKAGETSSAGRIGALETLTEGCGGKFTSRKTLHNLRNFPIINGFIPDCVSLRGLDAQNAHLPKIHLPGADLKDARLQNAGLWEANLVDADLTSAQLWWAEMSKANLSKANLTNAQMQGSQLPNATLISADLTQAKLNCLYKDEQTSKDGQSKNICVNLSGADLTGAILLHTDLSEATLASTQLSGANPPLLCRTQLPQDIDIDPNRDCDSIWAALKNRYGPTDLEERYSELHWPGKPFPTQASNQI